MTNSTPSNGSEQNGNTAAFSGYKLRPRQIVALDALRTSLGKGSKRPVMQAACSFGKTILSAEIINRALAKQKRVIFTVPSLGLVDQTASKFFNAGIYHIGIIQANHPQTDPTAPVQIASVQTLMRRKELPQADLVIADECHISFAFQRKWMAMPEWQRIPFIGLSATPWRKGLGQIYDDLVVGATMQQMMDENLSCPMRIYNPEGPKPDLSKIALVKNSLGEMDYHLGQLGAELGQAKLIGHVVNNWLEKGRNRRTLAFCVNRVHAKNMQAAFEKAGVKTAYMDAYTTPNERALIGRKLESQQIQIVIQIATCIYGIDWPFLECIIWDRSTQSSMILVQGLGRGIRLDPANPDKDLVVFDHSLTTTREGLGHPLDIHYAELDDGKPKNNVAAKKREKEQRPETSNTCSCGFVKRKGQVICPDCGTITAPPCDIEHAPGELYEVRPDGKRKPILDRQLWYSGLLSIGDLKGYQEGWAARQFKAKTGDWPNGLSRDRRIPTPEIENYAKSRLIRYAFGMSKSRQGRAAA